jgi:hypothetical protein
MPRIIPPETPIFRRGMNGNYYVYCKHYAPVVEVAKKIGKTVSSVYFNPKYQVWAIRCRCKVHKQRLLELFAPPKE